MTLLEYVYMDVCIFMYIGFYVHILWFVCDISLYIYVRTCMFVYAYVIEYLYLCVYATWRCMCVAILVSGGYLEKVDISLLFVDKDPR